MSIKTKIFVIHLSVIMLLVSSIPQISQAHDRDTNIFQNVQNHKYNILTEDVSPLNSQLEVKPNGIVDINLNDALNAVLLAEAEDGLLLIIKENTCDYHPVNYEEMKLCTGDYTTNEVRLQGFGIVCELNQEGNLFGVTSDYVSYYESFFYADTAGTWYFATDSADASEIEVDGQIVASWYGEHTFSDDWSHNGSIELDTGWHRFIYRQENKSNQGACRAAFKKPSDTNWRPVSTTDLTIKAFPFEKGLLLINRKNTQDTHPQNHEGLTVCVERDSTAATGWYGFGIVEKVDQMENPHGNDDNYTSYYKGYFFVDNHELGTWYFGLNSDDAAEIEIDGQVITSWYGEHVLSDDWVSGSIILDYGWHKFICRHEEGTGEQGIKAAFKRPVDYSNGFDWRELSSLEIPLRVSWADLDNDGLPNSVETMIGTEPENTDSDLDELDDFYETINGLNPLEPDSNNDGLADYLEITENGVQNVRLDTDNDGIPNVWDSDNDGDNVTDKLDSSPYSQSEMNTSFHFDIETNGSPTYMDFQVRPENPDHLRFPWQSWDWPYDDKGLMKDLDNSKEDIMVVPMLEFSTSILPPQSELTDYGIGIVDAVEIINKGSSQARGYDCGLVGNIDEVSDYEVQMYGVGTQGEYTKWKIEPTGDGWYWLKSVGGSTNRGYDFVMVGDINEESTLEVQMEPPSTHLWKIEPSDGDWSIIINKRSTDSRGYVCTLVGDIEQPNNLEAQMYKIAVKGYYEQWKMVDAGNGWFRLVNKGSSIDRGYDCTLFGNIDDTGELEAQMDMLGNKGDYELWKLEDAGGGWSTLVNKGSTADRGYTCTLVGNIEEVSEQEVQMDSCRSQGDYAKWEIEPAADGWYRLVNKGSSESRGYDCTLVGAIDEESNLEVQMEPPNTHLWKMVDAGDGWYRIINKQSTDARGYTCVLVGNIELADNLEAQMYPAGDMGNYELWRVESSDAGWIKLINKGSSIDRGYDCILYGNIEDVEELEAQMDRLGNKGDYELWKVEDAGGGWYTLTNKGSSADRGYPCALIGDIDKDSNIEVQMDSLRSQGDYALWKIGNKKAYIPLCPVQENGIIVAYNGRMAFPTSTPASVSADVRLIWMVVGKTDDESGTITTTLAKYPEKFQMTGFSVEENYGTDVGLFYSPDKDETTSAYVVLRYEFLNSNNQLSLAPEKLNENSVNVSSLILSYPQYDKALKAVTTELTQIALNNLPDGQILPITFATGDISADSGMDEFAAASHILGNSFNIDLTVKNKVTTKAIKMDWYDTSDDSLLEIEEIVAEVESWGLDVDITEAILKLLLVCYIGESKISAIGPYDTHMDLPEKNDTLLWMKTGTSSIATIINLPALLYGLGFYNRMRYAGYGVINSVKAAGAYYNVVRGIKTAQGIKRIETITGESADCAFKGKFSSSSRVAKGLKVLGFALGIGISFYAFYQVANQGGWTNYSIALGALYGGLMLGYFVALEIIALIPAVGAILVGLIIVSDLICWAITGTPWSDMVIKEIIDWMSEYNQLSKVDMGIKESWVITSDNDDNGLDVGDHIEYAITVREKISITSDGTDSDLTASYITPSISFSYGEKGYYGLWELEPTADGWNRLVNKGSSEDREYDCVLVGAINEESSLEVQMEPSATHLWKLQDAGSGWYTIINKQSTDARGYTCVLVGDIEKEDNLEAQMYQLGDRGNYELWRIETGADGWVRLINKGSSIDRGYDCILYGNIEDVAELEAQMDRYGNKGNYEFWKMDDAGYGWFTLTNKGSSTDRGYPCALVGDIDLDSNLEVQMDSCRSLGNYAKWNLVPAADGWYRLLNNGSTIVRGVDCGLVGDIDNDSVLEVQMFELGSQGDYELWKPEPAYGFPGFYRLINKGSSNARNYDCALTGDISLDSDLEVQMDPSIKCRNSPAQGFTLGASRSVVSSATYSTWREKVHKIKTWLDITEPRINLEIGVRLNTEYKVYYEECVGDSCTRHSRTDTQEKYPIATFYFDVLPSDIGSFLSWNAIIANDSDGDELDIDVETTSGTNPNDWDTDGDELSDGFEVKNGSSPVNQDTDSDGLNDKLEFILGTDPDDSDSDDDGLSDSLEFTGWQTISTWGQQQISVNRWSDPLVADSDWDGLNDSQEYTAGSNPKSQDCDGDGFLDGYEVFNGTDPLNPAPLARDDTYTTEKNTNLTVTSNGLLANDSDRDRDVLTTELVDIPLHGMVTLNSDGSFTYYPETGFSGIDRFTYCVNDGTDDSNVATVTLKVLTMGDANSDGIINILDLSKIARIILNVDSEITWADANLDGFINVLDMTKIARIILCLE